MKRVITSGCSFSFKEGVFLGGVTYDWPIWPELVCEHYGWELSLNLARGGQGNDRIIDDLYVELLINPDKYDVVLVGLSTWDRFYLPYFDLQFKFNDLTPGLLDEADLHTSKAKKVFKEYTTADMHHEKVIRHTLLKIIQLKTLCEQLGKKLIMAQVMPADELIPDDTCRHAMLKAVLDDPLFDMLDENDVIGYPFFYEFGGKAGGHHGYRLPEHCISELDEHPNAAGMKFIADWIIKELH